MGDGVGDDLGPAVRKGNTAPAYKPAPAYKEPAYDEPAAYNFQYGVQDSYSGANFGQNEARDGYATNGEYRVALPDGRTQIVTYTVQMATLATSLMSSTRARPSTPSTSPPTRLSPSTSPPLPTSPLPLPTRPKKLED